MNTTAMKTPNQALGICAALVGTLLLPSCTKDQQEELKLEAEVLIQYNAVEFIVAPTEVMGEMQLTITLDGEALSRTLSNEGYTMDQLKEFNFTSADLRIQGSSAQTYDPLQRVSLDLSLDGGTPVTVASKDPVPDGAQTLSLNVSQTNVADIMRHQHIRVIAKLTTDQAIPDTMYHAMDLGGKVVVKL